MKKQNKITEFKNDENKEAPSSTGFYLIDIWELITTKNNKTENLRKLTEARTNRKKKIIAISENAYPQTAL